MTARHTLVRSLHSRRAIRNARPRGKAPVGRVLVIRPDHLGDLLFATPALGVIRKALPEAHITGAVGPWGKAMWSGNPDLDALVDIRFPGIIERSNGLGAYRLLGAEADKLYDKSYDLGIVLRFDYWWGAALLWAAGVPNRWGYRTGEMAAWLTLGIPYKAGRHEVEQDLYLAYSAASMYSNPVGKAAGMDRTHGEPPLTPPEPLKPETLPGGWEMWLAAPRRAIIHPGTAAANKLWTVSGWAEVARTLVERGYAVAFTGSPAERPLAGAIAARVPDASNFAGETAGIEQLAWLFTQAGMVLGVDSGPLHLADALGKPSLHLYGPSDEVAWGPWGDPGMHRTLRAPGTRPTMHLDVISREIEGGAEMRAITLDMVMREVDELARIAGT
ncbi:MAG: glycosyltransferase family 9 protein [Chloroflexota bacterium]|nr:glycosyltransferase family 9 protein [Chloroflexota bacterium]